MKNNKCPYTYLKTLIAHLNPRLLLRRQRINNIITTLDDRALTRWREGHAIFFVLIQGVALELRRFKAAFILSDFSAASRHIDRASSILIGSATAMRLAGDIDRARYATTVITAMQKAHPKFSGSDSADHDYLVASFRSLTEIIDKLPRELADHYDKFLISADVAVSAHVEVCSFHQGRDRISTGSGSHSVASAIDTLIRLTATRLMLLIPKSRCPIQGTKRSRTPSAGDGNNDTKETK